MANLDKPGNSYIPSLDGIRALSIIVVILSHSGFDHIVPGGFGVTVFFFLSGFLITSLMLKEHKLTQTIRLRRFFLRRFFRLFPPLFVTLVIAYLLVMVEWLPGKVELTSFIAQIGYFANYYALFFDGFDRTPVGTGLLWSLAVEEHFYTLYPLIMCMLLPQIRVRHLSTLLMGACGLVLLWRIVLATGPDFVEARTYFATDTRIDSILWGCVLALWVSPFDAAKKALPLKLRHYVVMGLSAAVLLVSFLYRDPIFRETFRYTIQGVAIAPLFYLAVTRHRAWLFSWLNLPVMKLLGRYSYAMYLCHYIVIHLLWEVGIDPSQSAAIFAFTLPLAVGYGYLIDRYVDHHFVRIRHSLRAPTSVGFPSVRAV